ncbi:MAG TPA: AAA-like domain-containing protein [Nostocaceae cyanobacterium]|nr:AAA-like domain-containing protein [Nostocaceae cyanobacterium]
MKRRRGVMLTAIGLKKLQTAIQQLEVAKNKGARFTVEKLSERSNLSTKTLSRLLSLNSGVDKKTLNLCFIAFNLELKKEDYTILNESEDLEMFPHINFTELVTQKLENKPKFSLSYPDGPVPLDCPFYIERPPIENLAYQEITQPGCVIRIRAPKQMGKSSLMLRLLKFAQMQEYQTVNLNCSQIDTSCLNDLNKFLRGFCLRVANSLEISPNLDDYWDEEIGSKLSCSFYFKNYLLKQIKESLVLAFNEIDQIFEYPELAREFFPMLRSWYEEARTDTDWQKLRLVVVYSTEEYVALDINRSPFNIGLPLNLPEFTQSQVKDLAQRHGLNWSDQEVMALMELVGGHPSLVRIALYYICTQGITLNELLQESIASNSIFHNHLWRQWITLQNNPQLVKAMQTIITSEKGCSIDPIQAYKLESQGLIYHDGKQIKPRCELYRAYFRQIFSAIRN